MSLLKSLEYKKRNITVWNEVAPRYHKRWASVSKGPFQSTTKLIELVEINKGDSVLDIACGTGVVTKNIRKKVGNSGYVVGVDTSSTAIKIAEKWSGKKSNVDFLNIDAENFNFSKKFDIITCQYALFFFPNADKALKNMKNSLKESGKIGISVHGRGDKVPFFSNILDSVKEFIPEYVPPGSPNLDRYGTKSALSTEISKAGFSEISVKEFIFHYSPGKFTDYWDNYIKYIAKPLKEKLNELDYSKRKELKQVVKEKTLQYTKKNGKILFPWQVLILTAKH
ncbi:MAG: methyltransferase domain-containing protein [Nitrosopumilus sp.]|uniref:Ubiquinone/menaquinone biosynthesis methyltransferase n=1 Tax=Nitrosopumilus zosterae TaxID=718286 RepID=A0A2S2KTJ6_9ARCH|nr:MULTISPECIES: methyltransferase domain-containing protein [Nitrosopumilus]MCV0365786.1 methyltransferase domain-containing protein [Nitrosopumilus sp.]BDQ29997.1 methyltransferase domain-containing protein [Nitrosopumilus zosterae]GBH34901.1 ubiquinone/menaquinone biosynthesis methyltransferase [Nitrosopumilus zosterae]